jgi:hypothetical protein
MRKAVSTASAVPNRYAESNIIFSPDERFLLTGVAAKKGEGQKGDIVVLNREGLTEHRRITVGVGSVIKVAWQSKINQVCNYWSVYVATPYLQPYLATDIRHNFCWYMPRSVLTYSFDPWSSLTT